MNNWPPQDQVCWYLNKTLELAPICQENITADVAIIGGGMAGLSAAQAWRKRGKKVVLLEQYYCGSGASGKSSGFITPNAELSFTDFANLYNFQSAHTMWDFFTSGVNDIRHNIQHHQLDCDYTAQDTLMVANSPADFKKLATEYTNLAQHGYKTALYTQDEMQRYIASKSYFGAVLYEDSFGINGYLYCQEMKKVLQKAGVLIFENTPVVEINEHMLRTPHAQITAEYIVVCTDRFMPELNLLPREVYHAQTFLMISEPLTDTQIRTIFPDKPFLAWDSDLIYTYFRMTSHRQLLVGGGSPFTAYDKQPRHHSNYMFKKLMGYVTRTFPHVNTRFTQLWPGLIGLSKDIAPLAGCDKDRPYMFYVSAAAGLPIAAALGRYSAENLLDKQSYLDAYFSPYRQFLIGGLLQTVLGTKLSFALSNVIRR